MNRYDIEEEWMGVTVRTLVDLIPENPRAIIVGLNPAPVSVQAGHYYQGRTGSQQLRRLAQAGLFEIADEHEFEESALRSGVGFTDIVKRSTIGEGGVKSAEIAYGRVALEAKLANANVPLVVCVFRHPVKALLGSEGTPGVQAKRTTWGATVFRMPGPYAPRGDVRLVMSELTRHLASH